MVGRFGGGGPTVERKPRCGAGGGWRRSRTPALANTRDFKSRLRPSRGAIRVIGRRPAGGKVRWSSTRSARTDAPAMRIAAVARRGLSCTWGAILRGISAPRQGRMSECRRTTFIELVERTWRFELQLAAWKATGPTRWTRPRGRDSAREMVPREGLEPSGFRF